MFILIGGYEALGDGKLISGELCMVGVLGSDWVAVHEVGQELFLLSLPAGEWLYRGILGLVSSLLLVEPLVSIVLGVPGVPEMGSWCWP